MHTLTIEKQENAESVTLHFGGKIEMASVAQVKDSLDLVGTRKLVLDFSHVVATSDAALGAIVDRAGREAECRGLGSHQQLIIRYLRSNRS